MTLYRVYAGRSIPGGGKVRKKAFESFLKLYVDPTLPGYTIFKANGFWNGTSEKCYVLEFLDVTFNFEHPIYTIAETYKSIFSQESVMVMTSTVDDLKYEQ